MTELGPLLAAAKAAAAEKVAPEPESLSGFAAVMRDLIAGEPESDDGDAEPAARSAKGRAAARAPVVAREQVTAREGLAVEEPAVTRDPVAVRGPAVIQGPVAVEQPIEARAPVVEQQPGAAHERVDTPVAESGPELPLVFGQTVDPATVTQPQAPPKTPVPERGAPESLDTEVRPPIGDQRWVEDVATRDRPVIPFVRRGSDPDPRVQFALPEPGPDPARATEKTKGTRKFRRDAFFDLPVETDGTGKGGEAPVRGATQAKKGQGRPGGWNVRHGGEPLGESEPVSSGRFERAGRERWFVVSREVVPAVAGVVAETHDELAAAEGALRSLPTDRTRAAKRSSPRRSASGVASEAVPDAKVSAEAKPLGRIHPKRVSSTPIPVQEVSPAHSVPVPDIPAPPIPQTLGMVAPQSPSSPLPSHLVDVPARLESVPARIRSAFERGARELRIRLDPPELGGLDVKLSVDGTDVRVTIRAEHHDAASALQHALHELRSQLAHSGLNLAEAEVSSDGDGGESWGAGERGEREARERGAQENEKPKKREARAKGVRAIA